MKYAVEYIFSYAPPHQLKPVETVVERVVSRQSSLSIVVLVGGGHFSGAVVHLSHLLQPLPVNDHMHSGLMGTRWEYIGHFITGGGEKLLKYRRFELDYFPWDKREETDISEEFILTLILH